jgi:hypothetical protein
MYKSSVDVSSTLSSDLKSNICLAKELYGVRKRIAELPQIAAKKALGGPASSQKSEEQGHDGELQSYVEQQNATEQGNAG